MIQYSSVINKKYIIIKQLYPLLKTMSAIFFLTNVTKIKKENQ